MRVITRTVAFIILLSSVVMFGESVHSLYSKGAKAEAKQDYLTAYQYYKKAYDQRPGDLKYQVAFERTRFLAAATLVKQGQKLREEGKLQEALELFLKASAIDPSNDLALQEARHTQEMIKGQAGGEGPPAPPEPDALHKRLEEAGGPVELAPLSNVPLTLHVTSDAKQVYETIGKLAGLNVLFDPDYTSRRLSLDLQGVSVQQALDIVALESRTFWRPVTPNTIFVAADTQTKRRELEQNVIKTFYLGNVATPTDLQDVVNAIRTILEVQRIQQIPSQNAIVVRGTPDQLALAQKMIDDIDKSKPEVIVDVVVAQVRRDKVRQMGILPPQNASVALSGSNATTTTTNNNGSGGTTTTPTTTTTGNLNFNNLQHLNSTNYAVTIDPLHAQLLFSDSDTKILENPRIRAADGIKANLKIGDRIPVATGSFGTPLGIGTGVGALGVNTQFQYIDVGVKIDLTPHVHPDNEISLKVALEISNQTGTSTIGGISQPIISQRSADQEIRLRDGEMNLLGGILEDQIINTSSGTPVLGQIPILKYLFSQNDKERHTNEIVFLLIPHIVRAQMLSPLNRREFDVGSGVGIDLRKNGSNGQPTSKQQNAPGQPQASAAQGQQTALPPAGQPPTTAPGQSQPGPAQRAAVQQAPNVAGQQPNPVNPGTAPPGNAQQNPATQPNPAQQNPSGQPATTQQPNGAAAASDGAAQGKPSPSTPTPVALRLDPPNLTPTQGSSFALNLTLAGGQDVASVPVQLTYDPKILQFVSVSSGDFLGKDGQPVALAHRDDPNSGSLQITAQRPPGTTGVSGNGVVFNLMFMAKAKGAATVVIATPGARNSQNQPLQATGSQAAVNVN